MGTSTNAVMVYGYRTTFAAAGQLVWHLMERR